MSVPYTFIVSVESPVKVGLNSAFDQSMLSHLAELTFMVTVCPAPEKESVSKITLSLAVGKTEWKVLPPEVVAQCERLFQLPVPPTQ